LARENDDDPDASNRRVAAARHRAAAERAPRVRAALGKLAEIEAERARRAKTKNYGDSILNRTCVCGYERTTFKQLNILSP